MDAIKIHKYKIEQYLQNHIKSGKPEILIKALRYSTLDGGKRLRPILCIAGFKACGGKGNYILPVACAIELVHTFSLIHDDLPCMDNDDFRRGKPTSHKIFGEDVAILAGDTLLTMAFEWISDAPKISNQKKMSIIKELSNCVGPKGLIGGQVLDLRTTPHKLSPNTIKYIYLKKTAKLITVAVRIGAIAAGGSKSKMNALTKYGENLGMAFQIVDDLLDLAQDAEKKISYPAAVGKEKAYKYAKGLIAQAISSLKPFSKNVPEGHLLEDISKWVINQVPETLTNTLLERGPSNSAK